MNLEGKLEQAMVSYLTTAVPGLRHYRAISNAVKEYPCTIVHCHGGPEEPMNTGNHMMQLEVATCTRIAQTDPNSAVDPADTHNANVSLVRTALAISDDEHPGQSTLAAALSPLVSDFYVFQPVILGQSSQSVNGDVAVNSKMLTVYCCAADLT